MSRRRHPMEWFEIGEAIVAALDDGMTQREVARELGKSQPFVSKVARWWLSSVGETRWYMRDATGRADTCADESQAISARRSAEEAGT
jgi:hypothetical protein